ncbi:helix-turn-helix domain-containing protein [Listeria booriae]|uniref:helix-turn-helix domain-containing protein n=1 Tax=Listeria booriae TaxID=1552123 RepID=UPI001626D30F|nr:helix-turn-helix transcriptional regulator [Listeria booriae]MBC2318748.1 helix-turn-helix transcriptional regulator [Listeria booriae]
MNTKEIVKELANNKKMTIAEVERKLKIANGTIGKWDKQNPSVLALQKVADFFGVSVDYLLGRSEAMPNKENSYSKATREIAAYLEEDKEFAASIKYLMDNVKKANSDK